MSVQIQGGRRHVRGSTKSMNAFTTFHLIVKIFQTNFRPYSRAASVAKRIDDSTEQKRTRGGFSTDDSKVLQGFFLEVKMKEN